MSCTAYRKSCTSVGLRTRSWFLVGYSCVHSNGNNWNQRKWMRHGITKSGYRRSSKWTSVIVITKIKAHKQMLATSKTGWLHLMGGGTVQGIYHRSCRPPRMVVAPSDEPWPESGTSHEWTHWAHPSHPTSGQQKSRAEARTRGRESFHGKAIDLVALSSHGKGFRHDGSGYCPRAGERWRIVLNSINKIRFYFRLLFVVIQ